MEQTILIIEDEKELAQILGAYLKVEGFHSVVATDGQQGLACFREREPSLVLLDIMLPKIDGITVCREIRAVSEVPVIMISAKNGEMDKVVALGIGADDYVTKPFSPLELIARVKAQLRRYDKSRQTQKDMEEQITVGDLILSVSSYQAVLANEPMSLTTKEFEILLFLARNRGHVLSKTQIYEGVWGYDNVSDDNSVTVYINRIREKMGKMGYSYIQTVWGAGYKLTC